jgi:cobalt/nickel transport system permease protein
MTVGHLRGHGNETIQVDHHSNASWFGLIDSRAKLVGVLSFVVVSATLTDADLIVAALAVALAFAAMSGVRAAILIKSYLVALPFIVLASISVFLFVSIESGINMWARTSACVIPLLVLVSGTETFDLFAGLRRLRVPAVITTLLMLTHRYILVLSGELARMKVARRARGFRGGRSLLDKYGLKVLSNTAGMVLVRSSVRADRIYEGLKARGFDREMHAWRKTRIDSRAATLMACFLVVSAALVLLQLKVIA